MYKHKAIVLALLSALIFTGPSMYGQANMGAITGTVKDSTGAVVPGASIVITNEATGVTRNPKTDNSGFFS